MKNVRTAMESLKNAHSLVGELTLLRRNLLVFGLYRQTRAHKFDSHDRPHELQGPFELHETRRFIGQDPPVIVKIGRQLTSQLAEKLSNLSDLRLKNVMLRLTR